jgi:hypothetical protein
MNADALARHNAEQEKAEKEKKQGVAEASDRMQRYGQLILKRARAARDAEPEPKKQQPPALNSISTRELMQQLKKPKNKNVAAAPDYMEENIKRE